MSKGVYCLVMVLDEKNRMKIGRRTYDFPEGFYCYVGSAMNNLEERLKRHLSKKKKDFWHVDYFLKKARVIELKTIETEKPIECKISDKVKKLGDTVIPKFGSGDCKCESHLHYFMENPTFRKEFHGIFEGRF